MFCTNCGNRLQEGAAFCPKCGTKRAGMQLTDNTGYNPSNAVSPQNRPIAQHTAENTDRFKKPTIRKKHYAIAGIAIAVIVTIIVIVSAVGNDSHPLVGRWEAPRGANQETQWVEFFDNGIVIAGEHDGSFYMHWRIIDDALWVYFGQFVPFDPFDPETYRVFFDISGNQLTLDGWYGDGIFTRHRNTRIDSFDNHSLLGIWEYQNNEVMRFYPDGHGVLHGNPFQWVTRDGEIILLPERDDSALILEFRVRGSQLTINMWGQVLDLTRR